MSGDNVTKIPVKFKDVGKSGQMLEIKHHTDCSHFVRPQSFLVDRDRVEVECGKCGQLLNPMAVLSWMAVEETGWHRVGKQYQNEMRRLDERSRTKCEHCDKMTRISRR